MRGSAVAFEIDVRDRTSTQAAFDAALAHLGSLDILAANAGVSHRVKPIDLLVAAVAEQHQAQVLHYDGDYDLLSEHTDLAFASVWAVARGSIS